MKQSIRPRRLRRSEAIRSSVAETRLNASQLVLPLFLTEGGGVEPIKSMPGVSRYSLETAAPVLREAAERGLGGIALFPRVGDAKKNPAASEALNENGLIPAAIRWIKKEYPTLTLFTDIALDPFSSDGHDGLVRGGEVVNDETVAVLAKMAVMHARAGADFVCPSDMMDGRVGAIRTALDEAGFSGVGILSYCAKYASCFYGPFRDALDSAPRGGDKKTYQMDPRNTREALRELALDTAEGADIVMVKPAGAYLDVIHAFRGASSLPIAAYQVSGEYSMICFGAQAGLFEKDRAMEESLISIRRAGADLIFSYFALDMARKL
ncbi:MAG: porphobilinogen synthase [Bdellovibrionota bacterium]